MDETTVGVKLSAESGCLNLGSNTHVTRAYIFHMLSYQQHIALIFLGRLYKVCYLLNTMI